MFCSPTSDGGAAAILCSEKFVKEKGLQDHAVEIIAMEMATDLPSTFAEKSCIKIVRVFLLLCNILLGSNYLADL